jgi:hypothetical protein
VSACCCNHCSVESPDASDVSNIVLPAENAESWVVSTQKSVEAVVCKVPIARYTRSTADTCIQQQKPPTIDFLVFDASDKLIICTICSNAVPLKHLDGHLLHIPHRLNHKVWRATVARFVGLPVAQVFEDLAPRKMDLSRSPNLAGLFWGFIVRTTQLARQRTGTRC